MKLVMKYGGTSISSAKDIQNVAKHIHALSKQNQLVIVCSAISDTTDDLIEISQSIKKENRKKAEQLAKNITKRHQKLAKETIKKTQIRKKLLETFDEYFSELTALIDGMVLLGEVTPRSMDYLFSFGERLSIKLISAAINDLGKKSIALTGKEVGIVTDSNFGESKPLMDTTRLRVSKTLDSAFLKKTIPVIGGFVGADQHGHVTTFGRGGSDYSATIIGSSFNVENEGTQVTSSPSLSARNTVKCVSNVSHNGLIDIRGGSMIGTPGTAAKIFATLANAGINVMMISQNPSESSITIVVKNTDLDKAVNKLEMELLGKIIKKLEITTDMAIIALIGSGMRGTVGVASKVFGAMERNRVNVSMITQGSSELNLAFVVKNSDAKTAVQALHDEFELSKIN
ncbi:MAG: ACT domain-containing protein [Nitrosopumilaceae archaeon]